MCEWVYVYVSGGVLVCESSVGDSDSNMCVV